MSFYWFWAKIKLDIFSYVIFLPHVYSVTDHKKYNDPGYHDWDECKHPKLNVDSIGGRIAIVIVSITDAHSKGSSYDQKEYLKGKDN